MSTLFSPTALVVPFEKLRMTDVEAVGGKNASLGEMISQLPQGVRVPTGFATTAHAFREFLKHQGLAERIMNALNNTPLMEEAVPQAQPEAQAMPISALPLELKQRIPALSYGSHVFSSNPAKRAVMLNGREFREGSEVASGVTLIAIAQDYIILQVAGQNASLKALQDWRG